MSSLAENIGQAISDFDSIKQAIEDKGVTVGNAKTSEYAGKIGEIQTGQEVMFSGEGRCYVPNLIIPDGVTSIGRFAFAGCTSLTSATMPNSVTSIAESAFDGCVSLKDIIIPNSVTSIGERAFRNCKAIKTLYLPSSITAVGTQTLQNAVIENLILADGFNATLVLSGWWGTTMLSAENMVAMFETLADLTGQTAKTLTLGSTNLAKLTDEQKQIATNKNWNLA